jgi:hypothetical protein
VVRSARGHLYKATVVPSSAGREARGYNQRALPHPRSERQQAAQTGGRSQDEPRAQEWRDATWSATSGDGQQVFPFAAEHVREAYRATDPVQPRPGLYLRVQA